MDEIARDSSRARVYKQESYSRSGDIGIDAKGAVNAPELCHEKHKNVLKRSPISPAVCEYSQGTRISFSEKKSF